MAEKRTVVLQEATSQLPPKTPFKDVTVPEDAVYGEYEVRETGASSSRSSA
ncbi:hypothetical protein D8674_010326 [Pyrus ussuriensis x Pyrus communis]|uniref:Uncharacterized protein n=1 Tax=Pyrus ussuriensis x Pyrus communis TaxID=2448454 RepID=A0A5N5FAG0_9ROSA|nr:hypothetical protein D8674_010326 [Pyrus ussuriensis x Pyrus communis]